MCTCSDPAAVFAPRQLPQPDTMSSALRQLWLSAPPGRMSPWQQARALALREVSRELHAGRTQLEWVAARVEKVGGGSPGQDALHKFFTKVDADPDWFPGKQCSGKKRGRSPLLTLAKRRCIARAAMSAKHTQNKAAGTIHRLEKPWGICTSAQLVCTLNRPEPPPEPRFFGKA